MRSDQYIPLPPRQPPFPALRAKPLLLSGAQNVSGGGYRPTQLRPRPYNPPPGPPTPVPPRGFGGSGPFIPPEAGPRTRPLQFLNPGAGFSEQDVIDAIAAKMGY